MRPLNRIASLSQSGVARLIGTLQALERAVPTSSEVNGFLSSQRPDVLVVSPLIDAASDQVDIVRAARSSGIPVIAAIASWDNLTNKGHMRVEPDLVHGVERLPEDRSRRPARHRPGSGRSDWRTAVRPLVRSPAEHVASGVPATGRPARGSTGRPVHRSSVFIARSTQEVPFVRRWLEEMRKSEDPVLRDAAVLVRPHPFNADAWITADFSDLGPVAIWPRMRYTPAAEDARTSLFDSLSFCDAVVGINTSAMIEASILGKAVLSLLTPEFAGTRKGRCTSVICCRRTCGFLRVANAIDVHLSQLAALLRDPELTRRETEQFVTRFIRPHGITTPCTPILSDTIRTARCRRSASSPARHGRVAHPAGAGVAARGGVRLGDAPERASWFGVAAVQKSFARSLHSSRKQARTALRDAARAAGRGWQAARRGARSLKRSAIASAGRRPACRRGHYVRRVSRGIGSRCGSEGYHPKQVERRDNI
jgi:hypothetical protein